MTALWAATHRVGGIGALPVLPASRMLETEKAARRMGGNGEAAERAAESWDSIAQRLDPEKFERAAGRDIRSAIAFIWQDAGRTGWAAPLLDHVLAMERKSYDRAVVMAYLRDFPQAHPAFGDLSVAAEIAAGRQDWAWRERGQRWSLWDDQAGPQALARALIDSDDAIGALDQCGLGGDLSEGAFVARSFSLLCEGVGRMRGAAAEAAGRRLVDLFTLIGARDVEPLLVYGLLAPWAGASPSAAHRNALGAFMINRIGDPRLSPGKWDALERALRQRLPDAASLSLAAILRRWLTDQAVRAFFKIIARTTDRADQWADREVFWLGYLDQDAIADAWFAFGRIAEGQAGQLAQQEGVKYGRVSGGCDPSHSSLILTLGDLRIAEWSHSGACRFWSATARDAPLLFKAEYDGTKLRTTHGSSSFEFMPHTGSWQGRFAGHIYHQTGVTHPTFGKGW